MNELQCEKNTEQIRRSRQNKRRIENERETEREQQKTILLCDLQFKTLCMCCDSVDSGDSLEWDMLMRHLLCCIFAALRCWPSFAPTRSPYSLSLSPVFFFVVAMNDLQAANYGQKDRKSSRTLSAFV